MSTAVVTNTRAWRDQRECAANPAFSYIPSAEANSRNRLVMVVDHRSRVDSDSMRDGIRVDGPDGIQNS
jgi:hypothetical protein